MLSSVKLGELFDTLNVHKLLIKFKLKDVSKSINKNLNFDFCNAN